MKDPQSVLPDICSLFADSMQAESRPGERGSGVSRPDPAGSLLTIALRGPWVCPAGEW